MGTAFLYEDGDLVAFADIAPQAPFHVLVVPKRHITDAAGLVAADGPLLGKVFEVAARLVKEAGYEEGYRVVTNVGKHGQQSVPHLHFHVLAGRQMAWPPG
jgi:histidine triad (HIT) family protein